MNAPITINGSAHLTPLGVVAAAIGDEINTDYLSDMPDTDMVTISLSVDEVRRILTASNFEVALGACPPGVGAFQSRPLAPASEGLALQPTKGGG